MTAARKTEALALADEIETPADELRRLLDEYHEEGPIAAGGSKEEAWNLLADWAVENGPAAAAALDAAALRDRAAPSPGMPFDEMMAEGIRLRAKALVKAKGWKPGDTFGTHSVIEMLCDLGRSLIEKPLEERCAHPDCGCDFDEVCGVVQDRQAAPTHPAPKPEARALADEIERELREAPSECSGAMMLRSREEWRTIVAALRSSSARLPALPSEEEIVAMAERARKACAASLLSGGGTEENWIKAIKAALLQPDSSREPADSAPSHAQDDLLALLYERSRIARQQGNSMGDANDAAFRFAATEIERLRAEVAAERAKQSEVEPDAKKAIEDLSLTYAVAGWMSHTNAALREKVTSLGGNSRFKRGDRVRKIKGSSWQGHVVGHYSASLTPDGIAVESEREPGNVQVYPAAAFELVASAEEDAG